MENRAPLQSTIFNLHDYDKYHTDNIHSDMLLKKYSSPTFNDTNSVSTLEKYNNSLSLDCLVAGLCRQNAIVRDGLSSSESSDDDFDLLQAAEDEARLCPITDNFTLQQIDRIKPKRRFIQMELFKEDMDGAKVMLKREEKERRLQELILIHTKRKAARNKLRLRSTTECNIGTALENDDESSSSTSTSFVDGLFTSDNAAPRCTGIVSGDSLAGDQSSIQKRRYMVWTSIVKKETIRASKARNFMQKETMSNCKRLASQCMRVVRHQAASANRSSKETLWRAKRLTREMQAFWKRLDRAEKQQRRAMEREEVHQRKLDVELLEAKRQKRKLNFLITQTELYAHFMANKLNGTNVVDLESVLSQLDEEDSTDSCPRLAALGDDYNSVDAKLVARDNVAAAIERQSNATRRYNVDERGQTVDTVLLGGHQQPKMLVGELKMYQLKGMNWLSSLYDQGINGILADEMGLGKTVQALALLAHIAETYNIWGPFLIITPASTLHNWQQEITKFVPKFKVVPYWGSPHERKTLRSFWQQKNINTKSASFHIVITSYQLVITDFKYFNRVKWQYLVLDEAQAIKSSSSQRWKMLLSFECRNRLLLSGTPIQNSMTELWSLLHFVMPSVFDSHHEFYDWFSKDIESSAESKTQIDQKQINRLRLILKPFMLRRVKKEVEAELSDKLEILLCCPLTIRQKLLYMGLKRKIKVEDLLVGLGSQSHNPNIVSNLMNLVMQFRKVCNHPELFERRDSKSPFVSSIGPYRIPRLIFDENINSNRNSSSTYFLLYNTFCIFNTLNVHRSIFPFSDDAKFRQTKTQDLCQNTFSFLRFIDISPNQIFKIFFSLLARWHFIEAEISRLNRTHTVSHRHRRRFLLINSKTINSNFLFTGPASTFIAHEDVFLHNMSETVWHRQIRARVTSNPESLTTVTPNLPSPSVRLPCVPCDSPSFIYTSVVSLPVGVAGSNMSYVYDPVANETRDDAFSSVLITSAFKLLKPQQGWSNIFIPDKQRLVSDAGKLYVLDGLLKKLKEGGHRILLYSQMTRMIDILEDYMNYRQHSYMRLDGSSKISQRRDMVADFQERNVFVFLLSTRAGGLGINLTAADTVIFYDSDWNPTVDQQAMDRAHRLGQTKQVTVYRLICKGTIEERILRRACEKSEIQRMVIQGETPLIGRAELKSKEVVSLLLEDEGIDMDHNIEGSSRKDKEYSFDNQKDFELLGHKEMVPIRGPSPIFDFLGDEMGPKKIKKNCKRGRPPNLQSKGASNEGIEKKCIRKSGNTSIVVPKRRPGRPRGYQVKSRTGSSCKNVAAKYDQQIISLEKSQDS